MTVEVIALGRAYFTEMTLPDGRVFRCGPWKTEGVAQQCAALHRAGLYPPVGAVAAPSGVTFRRREWKTTRRR